jgi:hypothetical protein
MGSLSGDIPWKYSVIREGMVSPDAGCLEDNRTLCHLGCATVCARLSQNCDQTGYPRVDQQTILKEA